MNKLVVKTKDVYTDRAFNQIIPGSAVKISGSLKNYKVKWVHDVISESIWQWLIENGGAEKQETLFVAEDGRQILEAFKKLSQDDLPPIEFTDTDFRKIVKKKKLSGEQIQKLVEDYSKSHVKGEIKCYWNGKLYQNLTITGNLFTVVTEKTGKLSPTGKKPIHKYTLLWNFWGFMLLNNLLQHKIAGNDAVFYDLSGAEQNLDRILAQSEKSILTFKLSTMIEIMNLKIDPNNKRRQKQVIENHLKKLRSLNRISWYKLDDSGTELKFQMGIR